jgi:hypothetical protein
MTSLFDQQLGIPPAAHSNLPLAHTTTFETAIRILGSGEFDSPLACPIYSEKLLYTFVARPVYRFREEADPRLGLSFAPVCFLLEGACTPDAVRCLPFDSGGFNRYKHEMHPNWNRGDFEMKPIATRVRQVIEEFWSSYQDYYEGKPRSGLSVPAINTLIQQYYTLITNGVSHGFDSRCSTVEVQFTAPMPISGRLKAVFAPDRAADDAAFQALVSAFHADLVPYRYHEPFYPNDYSTSIFDSVEMYLNARGVL